MQLEQLNAKGEGKKNKMPSFGWIDAAIVPSGESLPIDCTSPDQYVSQIELC